MAMASQASTAAQWPKEHYEQAIQVAEPRRILLALEEKSQIQAFIMARVVDREWELENIIVAKKSRHNNLGSRLLKEFVEIARQENAEAIFLEVRESNHAARAFYEKWAFTKTGRRPRYYKNPEEDAILYRLDLAP